MKIGRVLAPVHSLGPGERVVLWTTGCSKSCPGCISEGLQPFDENDVNEKDLAAIVLQLARLNDSKEITVSGGDPFEQSDKLYLFLKEIRTFFDDVLVYTGYTLREIQRGEAGKQGIACLSYIDVLIDGRYVKEKNTKECVLRGSSNQQIIFLTPTLKDKYLDYMNRGRSIETILHNGTALLVGIFNRGEYE